MTEPTPSPDPILRGQLLHLLEAVEASGRAVLPRQDGELLLLVVEAAARIFGAAAASIALVDEAGQYLEFRVSYGAGNESLVGMRIPINQGIAGYVAITGQPLAVSNVRTDPRFSKDFAQSTGYVPQSILAMPLISGERVIGVMEVLDKISAPSFGMQDMELLGIFARQAAIAIHQAQQVSRLDAAFLRELRQLAGQHDDAGLLKDLLDGLAQTGNGEGEQLKAVADVFYALNLLGEAEQRACFEVLSAFARYAKRTPADIRGME